MPRFLIAIPLALGVTVGLFLFMAWMIDDHGSKPDNNPSAMSFDLVMQETESEVERRQRSVPPPPKQPVTPPQQPTTTRTTPTPTVSSVNIDQPTIDVSNSINSMDIAMPTAVAETSPVAVEADTTQQAMPIYRVDPNYPLKAYKRRIEGYVELSFTIDEEGRTDDIEVTDANPKRIFEREALRALRRWKYQPLVINGVAQKQPNQTVRIEFSLD